MALFQRKSREYMAMPTQKPRARSDDLVVEEVDDELLVYDSTNKRGHCLSPTAARVWRACDGYSDVSALSEALELDAEVVRQALDELEALELLDTPEVEVVQAGSGNGDGLTRRQLARRSATVGAGIAAAPLVYSINVSSAMALATPTNLACALFSTNACGTSRGAGAVSGCCCCCQGGGDCKIGGAITTCAMGSCPGGTPMCSSSCNQNCAETVAEAGCCGVGDSSGCGCAFAGGTANQDGCLCNDTNGACNDNPQTGCVTPCVNGAVNCGAGCCSKTGCQQVAAPGGGFFLINCPGCVPGGPVTDCVPCCNGSPVSQGAGPEGTVTFNCCVPGATSTCARQVFGV